MGVYLVQGGVPGPGGCTWSWGASSPRGVPGPGGMYAPGGVPGLGVSALGDVPGQVLSPL